MSAHTPGPWAIQVTGGAREAVSSAEVGLWAVIDGPSYGTRHANARLIAAAPDLLAAVQRLTHPAADDEDLEDALELLRVLLNPYEGAE